MGGDNAPGEVIQGALLALEESPEIRIHLVGRQSEIEEELARSGASSDRLQVVHAEHAIAMSDSPVEALREKRGSSIELAMRLVKSGEATSFVSAGNTGACVAASSLFLGRLRAVKRPGIAVVFHTGAAPVVVIDVGANVNCKPDHLIQYGVMASLYAQEILGVERPAVGLLNIGEEDEKGHSLAKETHSRFQQTGLNFLGNVEGSEIFGGEIHVVVCDGFVGNIVLKVSEGLAERLLHLFKSSVKGALAGAPEAMSLAPLLKQAAGNLFAKLDYSEYGGAPLLGVDGTVIIAHGRSDRKAIGNAIKVASRMAAVDLNSRITEELASLSGSS